MKKNKTYIICSVVFVASILLVVIFRYAAVSSLIRSLSAIPAVLALFGALFQLARDSIAFERAIYIEQFKNNFTVGATSEMAIVAFNRYVEFCEEYVREVRNTMDTLTRRGPHEELLAHSTALHIIREKWALWVTPEIQNQIRGFENALRRIGSDAWILAQHIDMNDRPAVVQNVCTRNS